MITPVSIVKNKKLKNVDSVLEALGPLGPFFIIQCILNSLVCLPNSYHLFSFIFTGQQVVHRCARPDNVSVDLIAEMYGNMSNDVNVTYGQCNIIVSRNISNDVLGESHPCLFGFVYEGGKDKSVISQFDLVCKHEALVVLPMLIMNFGFGVGSFACSPFSDWYGRKRTVIISEVMMLAGAIVLALAPNYGIYVAAKFVIGFFQAGNSLASVTAILEIFTSRHRGYFSGFLGCLSWALCVMSLAPVAFWLRFESWRVQELTFLCTLSVMIFQAVILSEPLRWLVANKKTKEITTLIAKAARWNRKDLASVLNALQEEQSRVIQEDSKTSLEPNTVSKAEVEDDTLSYKDFFNNRLLRTHLLVSCFIWFINNLAYFSTYLMSSVLAGSIYLNFFLVALAEGSSSILIFAMLKRLQRKQMLAVFHVFAGVGLIASSVCFSFQDSYSLKILGTVFSLAGTIGVAGNVNSYYLYTPEIFPTNLRNRAFGIALAFSTMGAMLASFSYLLIKIAVWVPGTIFGASSLISVWLLRLLPESKGRELPQTLLDLEAWTSKIKLIK